MPKGPCFKMMGGASWRYYNDHVCVARCRDFPNNELADDQTTTLNAHRTAISMDAMQKTHRMTSFSYILRGPMGRA